MKTKELIAMLQRMNPNGEMQVRIWDVEQDEYVPVTGVAAEPGSIALDICSVPSRRYEHDGHDAFEDVLDEQARAKR